MKQKYRMTRALLAVLMFFAICYPTYLFAQGQEEVIAGTVVKTDEGIIIEADDGDYLVKGMDLSKMVGKFVEVTGFITETEQGYVIDVKKVEEPQE